MRKIEDQLHVLEKAFKTSEESLQEAKRQLTQQNGKITIQNTVIMKLNEQLSEVKREKQRQKKEYENNQQQAHKTEEEDKNKELELCNYIKELKEFNEKIRTENEKLKEELRKEIKEKDGRAKEAEKLDTTVKKMEQELGSLKNKNTEVMKINKLLEEQSSEVTRESELGGRLKDLSRYNAATGEQSASIDNIPMAGERETTNRVRTSQSSQDTTHGSSKKETPRTSSRNTSAIQISRNSKARASRQSQECIACGSPDHKIRHCDKKRNIYVRNNSGILTKETIKDVPNNEQIKSIRLRKMNRTDEEAKEAFIFFIQNRQQQK